MATRATHASHPRSRRSITRRFATRPPGRRVLGAQFGGTAELVGRTAELVRWRSRSSGARGRNKARAVGLLHAGESRSGMEFGFHRRIARARVLLCLEMLLGARDGGP